MRIISNKKRKRYAWLVIITGIGVSVLTFFYISMANHESTSINLYCIINSALTLLGGFLLLFRKVKTYNFLAALLGLSVLAGFFFLYPSADTEFLYTYTALAQFIFLVVNSVSSALILLGAFAFGVLFGGFLWVPLFLFNSFYGLYKAIAYWKGKVKYEFESGIINT